jgi:chitinase
VLRLRKRIAVLALALAGASVVAPPAEAGQTQGKVMAYFADWDVYARNYHVKDIETSGSAAKLTHLNYAFGNVADGQCAVGDPWADHDMPYDAAGSVSGQADSAEPGALYGSFNQLLQLKKLHPKLKVLWSFGGWTWSAGFTEAAKNPAAFAESCYGLVNDPRWAGVFDGIDIDW